MLCRVDLVRTDVSEDFIVSIISHYRENLKSYTALTFWLSSGDMFPVRYKLGIYIPENGILQSLPWEPQILHLVYLVY
jgi:hypothetical protein